MLTILINYILISYIAHPLVLLLEYISFPQIREMYAIFFLYKQVPSLLVATALNWIMAPVTLVTTIVGKIHETDEDREKQIKDLKDMLELL